MSAGFRNTSVKPVGQTLIVNNRYLGEKGSLSQGFGTNSNLGSRRDKMQLKNLINQAKTADYQNNPIAQRRMQQKIASKASAIYGVDSSKLITPIAAVSRSANYGGNSTTGATSSNQISSNANNLAAKVNGKVK